VGDSLDLVVVGAYHGKGRRSSKFGAYLLACYNPSNQTYETICNIGTGFSDEDLDEYYNLLSNHVIDRPKPFYSHSKAKPDQPDVWFEPAVVWEVKTADLTLSPKYRAAEGLADASDKGVSLRFPRLVRIRDDKKPEQATNSRQVAELYRNQESITQSKKGGVDDDFEY
jgi:DNA ligase 1